MSNTLIIDSLNTLFSMSNTAVLKCLNNTDICIVKCGILSDKSNSYRACRILPCIYHSLPLVKIRFWTIKTKAFTGNIC